MVRIAISLKRSCWCRSLILTVWCQCRVFPKPPTFLHPMCPLICHLMMRWLRTRTGNGEVRITPKLSVRGPKWPRVFAGLSKMPTPVKFFCDHRFSPGTVQSKTLTALPSQCSQHVMSEFHFWSSPVIDPAERMDTCSSQWKPSCKQALCLECQAKTCHEVCSAELQGKRGAVRLMEVVSPPRFAPIVEAMGLEARSYDLKTGLDLSTARDRQLVEEDLVNI